MGNRSRVLSLVKSLLITELKRLKLYEHVIVSSWCGVVSMGPVQCILLVRFNYSVLRNNVTINRIESC